MEDIATTLKATKRLVDLLCRRGAHDAARDVVEATEELFHPDDRGWLRSAVEESKGGELVEMRRAALELLGVEPDVVLPAGLNLSTSDVLSAKRAGWRIVVEPGSEPAVRATSSPEDDPLGQGTWASYREGSWVLSRVDNVGESRDVRAPFMTLRAAIAFSSRPRSRL